MWQSRQCKVVAKAEYHHQYCFSDHYQNQKSVLFDYCASRPSENMGRNSILRKQIYITSHGIKSISSNCRVKSFGNIKKQVISKIYLNINCIVIWKKKIKTRLPMFSDVIAHLCRSMHIWNNVLTKQTGYDQLTSCVKINEENRLLYYQHTH